MLKLPGWGELSPADKLYLTTSVLAPLFLWWVFVGRDRYKIGA